MWQNFHTKSNNLSNIIASLEELKKNIFDIESVRVKEYFARKVVLSFDNLMIFFAPNGLELNLKKALAESQEDMKNSIPMFPSIKIYLLKEMQGYSLLIKNLEYSDVNMGMFETYGFDYIGQEDGGVVNIAKLEYDAISFLAFDFSLVDYTRTWFNYTPALEDRAVQQVEHILFRMTFKKIDSNLNEQMQFLENIKNHPNYKELYQKIIRLMPKLEISLEKQWRISIVEGDKVKLK